jgi:hypothetical protein
MMIDLYHYSLLSIFLVGLGVILVAGEIGWQLGMRAEGRGGESIATLEAAVLGLLALIIGFTFAMALARFEARRDAVVNEANAIGTTALRARLLPEPQRTETLKLLRDYVQVRLDLARSSLSLTESPAAVDRSNALQEAIWQHAKAVAARDNAMVPTGLFIQTLNEMIDSQGRRLAALRNRIPNSVLLSLFAIAAVASAFAGYASGLETRRTRLPVYLLGLVVCAVLVLILDLDRPTAGFIKVSEQPMLDTAASLAAFSD